MLAPFSGRLHMDSARKRARHDDTDDGASAASTEVDGIELKSPHAPHPLMEALADERRLGTLCDITFVVEGEQFKAHRVVLVACSDFMRSLICGDFKESSSPTVTLNEVASSAFGSVLEFCYEGRCRVPDVTALEELVAAAARFQVLELRTTASHALQNHLSAANCMSLWSLAERLSLAALAAAATETAAEEFEIISADMAFESLPKPNLQALLQSESLQAGEDVIYGAIVRWLRAQTAEAARAPEVVGSLMQHCRFGLMPLQFMQTTVRHEPMMQSAPALKVLSEQLLEKAHALDTPRTQPRTGRLGWRVDAARSDFEVESSLTVDSTGSVLSMNLQVVGEYGHCIVPFAKTPIATGRHEFRLKLLVDAEDQTDAGSGFGFMSPVLLQDDEFDGDGMTGLWWLRRYETRVYTGGQGGEDYEIDESNGRSMRLGAEVRMVLDMNAREATFFIDGTELQVKATGIAAPVLPCVFGYGERQTSFQLLR